MKPILIILFSFLLVGCGSVRKVKDYNKNNTTDRTTTESNEKTIDNKELGVTSNSETIADFTNFNIKPINGQFADFEFNYGGTLLSGRTSGEVNFTNEKKTAKAAKEIIYKAKIETKKYYLQNQYKVILTITKTKEKITETKFTIYFWIAFVAAIISIWEILRPKISALKIFTDTITKIKNLITKITQ